MNGNIQNHYSICKICSSGEKRVLYTCDFTDDPVWSFISQFYQGRLRQSEFKGALFSVAKCLRCGFMWQINVLNAKGMQRLYEKWIDPNLSFKRKFLGNKRFYRYMAADICSIGKLFDKEPIDITVFDFGMGWGAWCLMAKAFGYQTAGLEISEKRLNFVKKMGIEAYSDLAKLGPKKLDYINAEQVFEHLPEPLETLKELAKHLRKGGIVHLSVPNGAGIEDKLKSPGWRAGKNAIAPLEHINCFTRNTLALLGNKVGLSVISPPFISPPNATIFEAIRGTGGYIYNRFVSTSLYFKKI